MMFVWVYDKLIQSKSKNFMKINSKSNKYWNMKLRKEEQKWKKKRGGGGRERKKKNPPPSLFI
jgi:hypothetical protein